ncbi:iron complex outermembrane receptor protein [Pontibacter ummariensis]|uniref:Iron complex outermembrane recepter protein n=1 Tax=Pontibacter ummariensis TaxID=1610492 RepID=A0A239JTS3_9BACT|nr:TonB-dependent receptor [Pontibacter ummariensis]PRY07431.1 iron complex outermembrane receptor protein [Pontibacter ummariensis]SNT09261.1 iron complex outermembrane recepter protein [Pontibacter ummariensis]
MKRTLLFLVAYMLLVVSVYAQTGRIRGTVLDTENSPLPFGSVFLQGTNSGATTNEQGAFILENVKAGEYRLIVSAVGFERKSLPVQVKEGETKELQVRLSPGQQGLSEVVVSASRTPETIDQVPSSITVLSRKAIEEDMLVSSNVIDILSNKVPGLAPSTGTSSNWGQTLRGRPMLVMIDGVPQSTPLRNGAVDMRALDPDAIEQVEVIKGATAIYGNGAAGGLINYITRTPRQQKPFSSRTTLGMTGSLVDADNSIGARVSQMFYGKTGKFDYVLSGAYEQTGEWKDAEGDVLPPDYGLGETDAYNGFVKLGYDFTAFKRLQLTYNYYSSEQKSNYVPAYGNYQDRQKTRAVLGETLGVPQGVRSNHNLNLRFSGEHAFLNSRYEADAYYQSVDNVFFWSPTFEHGGQSMISSEKKGARGALTTPYKISTRVDGDVTYGLDVLNDVTSQPLVDGRTWVPEMNMLNVAPFVQLKTTIAEDLIFKGGFRAEKVNIAVEDYTTLRTVNPTTGAIDNPGFAVKGGELGYNAYLFNAGLRYNKYDLFTPYASFSQGFSVADIGVMLRSARVDDISKISTEAIVINNYEAGFVSKFGKIRLEGVGFISTSELGASGQYKDGVFVVMRTPEKIHGFEATADAAVLENLSLGATFSYVEGKRDANENGSFNDGEDVYLGGERISPPKYTAYLRYALLDNKLRLNLQYTGIGSRDRFDMNEKGTYNFYQGPVDPYQLVNLSASYRLSKNTTFNMGVENLLNEDYFPARSQWFTSPTLYTKGKGAAFNVSMVVEL